MLVSHQSCFQTASSASFCNYLRRSQFVFFVSCLAFGIAYMGLPPLNLDAIALHHAQDCGVPLRLHRDGVSREE